MRKIILVLISVLIIANYSPANPIVPESLFAEVYFENNEWYLAIDNMLLEVYGIEDFENIQIFCNDGPLLLEPGFMPDFSQMYTILTNEHLINPVEIERTSDCITSFWDDPYFGYLEFTTLSWNDVLPSPVCSPFEGQALSIIMIPIEDMMYEWWLVKNNNPLTTGGSYNVYGSFEGYIYDQNNIPIPNARIQYIEPYYLQVPYNCFDTLITDNTGYFTISIPARNYYVSHVHKNNQQYFINEYVSIEPDSINFYEFTIDYIVGYQNFEIVKNFNIYNFPNPFVKQTEFVIDCKINQPLNNSHIRIRDMSGKVLSILPVSNLPDEKGQIKIKWLNSACLGAGHYIYSLYQDQDILATGKMIISE